MELNTSRIKRNKGVFTWRHLLPAVVGAFLTVSSVANAQAICTPVDNSVGAIFASRGNQIFSIDVTTGRAVLLTTSTLVTGNINSLATRPGSATDNNRIVYYTSDTIATGNVSIFGYDLVTGTHFTVDTDVTDNNIVVGASGIGSGGATFRSDTNTLVLGVENNQNTPTNDTVYEIPMATDGRTINGNATELFQPTNPNDFGDFVIVGSTYYQADGAAPLELYQQNLDGTGREQLSLLTDNSQIAFDRNGTLRIVTSVATATIAPVTLNGGTPPTATIGTTVNILDETGANFGAATVARDAAGCVPATSSIGNRIWADVDNDNVQDPTGEPGINGVTVQLINDFNNNGTVDAGETVIASQVTSGDGNYNFVNVAPGHYIVRVNSGVPAGWTNSTGTTSVINIDGNGTAAGDTITGIDQVISDADRGFVPLRPTIAKVFNPSYILPGQTSVLTITLTNPNTSAITLLSDFTDTLPTNVTVATPVVTATTCGVTTPTTTTTSVTLPATATIPAGSCTVTVTVTSSTLGAYTNTIAINALSTTAGTNAAAASAPLVVLEPLKRVKLLTDVDSSGTVTINDVVQYQIVYTLPAGSPAIPAFQIFDVLPAQVNYVATSLTVTPSGGTPAQTGTSAGAGYTGLATTATSAAILAAPVTLQPGGTITATINATINNTAVNGTAFNNTARASGTGLPAITGNGNGGGLPSDADATPFGTPATALPQPNDTATSGQATQVTPVAPASADLVVTKSQPSAVVNSGGNITYTVTVTNNGPNAATNVVVTDTLPAGTTFVSASNGGTQAAGVVIWNSTTTPALSSLANTASQSFTVVITAP